MKITETIELISLTLVAGGLLLGLCAVVFLTYIAKGESEVNGDPERDGGMQE